MFNSLEEQIQAKRSGSQFWRKLVSGLVGVALAGAGFQTVYTMIFALE